MRILFVTNFYPPLGQGGYEAWCAEVAGRLRQSGHEVVVLTSRHLRDTADNKESDWIRRDLHLEMPLVSLRNGLLFFTRHARGQENLGIVDDTITAWQPDVALIWGMWNLPRSLPARIEARLGSRVAYYFGDYWPTLSSPYVDYWNAPVQHPLFATPKRILGKVARRHLDHDVTPDLSFRHVMVPSRFVSEELRRHGIPLSKITVVPGAVETQLYVTAVTAAPSSPSPADGTLSLLFVGRLDPTKGLDTAIQALALLRHGPGSPNIRLVVAGEGVPFYVQGLHALARQLGVADSISWLGRQPKEALPSLYRSADVFLFTSVWPEPFGRVIVEAMASGTAVVGAAAGGAAEIIRDGLNGLACTPGDAAELAAQTGRLLSDETLRQRLAAQGQRDAIDRWDLARMAEGIETELVSIVGARA